MAEEANPFETIRQIAAGACLPRCLHVVAELGVADALGDRPKTLQNWQPPSVHIRMLCVASCGCSPPMACSSFRGSDVATRPRRGCCRPITLSQ